MSAKPNSRTSRCRAFQTVGAATENARVASSLLLVIAARSAELHHPTTAALACSWSRSGARYGGVADRCVLYVSSAVLFVQDPLPDGQPMETLERLQKRSCISEPTSLTDNSGQAVLSPLESVWLWGTVELHYSSQVWRTQYFMQSSGCFIRQHFAHVA